MISGLANRAQRIRGPLFRSSDPIHMTITLFKNSDHDRFVREFADAVASVRGGTIDWNPNSDAHTQGAAVGYLASTATVSSIFVDAPCADVMAKMGAQLQVPYINLFFQEKMFWEFTLMVDGLIRIKFSVAPEEWGEVDPRRYVGTPEDLAELWSVPKARLERYMGTSKNPRFQPIIPI